MTGRHFEHGNLQLACRNSQLSLSLSSSFTLVLPPLDTEPVTADDISHLSRTGQLWIAKSNPCRLVVVLSSTEGMDLDTGAIRSCIDSIIDCPLWAELGLSLRPEADRLPDVTGSSTQTSLIINHPDLSSEFLAPPATPYAGFQTLSCIFKFHTRKIRRAATTPVERPRQSIRYSLGDNAPSNNSYSASHLDEFALRPAHTHISSGSGIHPGPCLGPGTAGILENQARDNTSLECPRTLTDLSFKGILPTYMDGTHDPEDWIADIPVLVSVALYRLIGVKKAMQGVRTTKNITSVPLIDIAPAVWNLRYLQSFASRVELLPAIASTLAGLSQAQSPAIRAKIRGLLTDSSPGGEDDRVYASIYQRLSLLVHLGLDVEPVSKPKNKNTTTSTTTGETGSTRLSVTMTRPEASQPLTQQTDVSDETLSTQLDLFGESMHSVTTWDSGPASAPAKDDNIEADKYTLTTPGETQLTMGMSSQDGVVVDEQGCPLPSGLAEDDYEYVYAIVPVPEGTEGGPDGEEESWFPTELDNQAGSFAQEPRDWGAWNTFSLPRHGGTLTDDEIQPRSQGLYEAGVDCGSGVLSSAYFADERTDVPLDEGEGQSMYISLNCPGSRGTI